MSYPIDFQKATSSLTGCIIFRRLAEHNNRRMVKLIETNSLKPLLIFRSQQKVPNIDHREGKREETGAGKQKQDILKQHLQPKTKKKGTATMTTTATVTQTTTETITTSTMYTVTTATKK